VASVAKQSGRPQFTSVRTVGAVKATAGQLRLYSSLKGPF